LFWESHSSRPPRRRTSENLKVGGAFVLAVLLLLPSLTFPTKAVAQLGFASPDTTYFREKKDTWLAIGEVVGLNMVIWSYDRFIREGGTNPGFRIGMNSWKENFKNGFEWDDNNFSTNQFAHPFHGSLYFNAARSNGFDYWESMIFSLSGSYMWEYFMETHHPAYNDWIATGIGGAAIGESLHRLSAMIWDNQAHGSNRFWREVGGFFVNPMGGLNRLFHGEMGRHFPNPQDAYPDFFMTNVEFGSRSIGEDRLWDSDTTRAYFNAGFSYGDPFDGDNKKPFESFDFAIQMNFGDKVGIGQLNTKGLLFAVPISESDHSIHMIGAFHHYDYMNNNAYEYGGQSLSASYLSKVSMGKATLVTQFHAMAIILGGTASDYEDFTGRDYSYGPGLGFKFKSTLYRGKRPFFTLANNTSWITAINGDAAKHFVSYSYARLDIPLGDVFGVGAQYDAYFAERKYDNFPDVSQRNPEIRFFMNWITD